MFLELGIASAALAIMLFLFSFRLETSLRRIARKYSYLFTACSLALGVMLLHQDQEEVRESLNKWMEQSFSQRDQRSIPITYALQQDSEPMIEQFELKSAVKIDAPLLSQYPELPRGCEVTSLAMLLNYHNISADKMTLADEIKKNKEQQEIINGTIHYGHPNEGFVGDMYNLANEGFGVYHKPVADLVRQYAGDRTTDLTGKDFAYILKNLNEGQPVWVITNTQYEHLPDSQFTEWQTPQGEITVTHKEHAVLVTGYDEEFIYFNDPLNKHKKAPHSSFKEAWVQMGKQAITIK
ncbi:C39 family peptidase [Thalassobacillus sp. CUG 92003]|uniref:C39 family peptidase n=1 Tax=Thalassobacillus sp. CUG 92003 TaxID=2736641 RepID=UPI002104C56F|nr:C39 family peptidase [Thalassobacillus sp. CUG 92003]